ncbi:hypothetical protein OJAV_G00109890 [Oryzias javanicus]|uniref:Peptide-N(4)-(N-acetyl-beta-glucosaminyl)asparagine amidase n=1 Tax=Oryzias javanicus TaxID=123683 RepID=A0A437CW81_ORYJA|nr:hypothetical protein OJAV_G00109890 [Oryzias javanicus]
MSLSPAVTTLCENSTEVFLDAAKLLLTYADNILRYPNVEKYRSIRIGNPTFSTKLLPIKGAVECLFEMGFEEAETHLVFPKAASVEQLRLVRESIAAERDQRLKGGCSSPPAAQHVASAQQSPTAAAPATTLPAGASGQPAEFSAQQPSSLSVGSEAGFGQWGLFWEIRHPAESSMSFFLILQSNFQHVLQYESPELQQKARSVIPHQELADAAGRGLKQAREADPGCKLGAEDFLVLELLRWFKQDFFSWVDCLLRVENHFCQTCQLSTRFPRYNNPEKLLQTRRGRCGEWANCFTLCCRVMGLEARYIWDSTDHVWTEVYSTAQRRWLHCDSCENTCDKPLLYEVGWGKKLAYILAFSKDQVVDVTWRYSCKHTEVLSRRTRVQEAWLLHAIDGLNASRQQPLSSDRKKELTQRLLVELVEFISPKKPKPGELGGRNSGSLAWRVARGETGAQASTQAAGFVFSPTETEKENRLLHVRYSATKDQYCRVSNSNETIPRWDGCVWTRESVFRKEEHDWKMVYIARTEGSSVGRVSWKFDFAPAGMTIRSVSIKVSSETFHSGKVRWHIQAGHESQDIPGDGTLQELAGLRGSSDLLVAAELSGGEGDSSWQHAQLFRRSFKGEEESSFEVIISLQEDS